MRDKLLKIGELAAQIGLAAKTIRFYEAAGVLPATSRGPNGYRLYGQEAADLLHFVRQARGLGLTLAEIKELVAIRRRGELPCPHVSRLLAVKAADLQRQLRDLQALRRELRRAARASGRRPPMAGAVCPHIEARAARAPGPVHSEA